ncbi:MAG TPA: zinc ABC transporter substrate-binding protein, partial [Steroidobacteraceae bacterium]|nr:zinc ABC transporter substrate-binding protein [Steroidobacteraceae bacterium]
AQLRLLEIPTAVDRSMGDIHSQGNPHVQLDPHNVATVARALSARLAALDPTNKAWYESRGADFQSRWAQAITRWESAAMPLRGVPVVVMHKDQTYLCHWLGMTQVASVEPKPGVPPSAGYLAELVATLSTTPARMILINAYNDPKSAKWLSDRVGSPVVTLPFSVGGNKQAGDLFALFDDTVDRLLAALK